MKTIGSVLGLAVGFAAVVEWAGVDLPLAAAWLAEWQTGLARDIAIKTMGAYLADTDPEKAREWIADLPENALKAALLKEACARGGGRSAEFSEHAREGPAP